MTNPPPMICFINGDLTYPQQPPIFVGFDPNNPVSYASVSELTNLQIQLFIDDTMTKEEFDARVAGDPNYPTIVHLQNLRILVILPKHLPFCEIHNLELADVVLFLHQGLADVEKNHWGPPRQNFETQRLTIYEILRAVHSPNVVTVPGWCGFGEGHGCETCNSGFFCDVCHTFSGIKKCFKCGCSCKCFCDVGLIDNQGIRSSPVHLPNCDRELNNPAFIHRK
jgi:hypothetical protein